MSLINSTAIPSGASAYEIEQSLRFNDDDTPYLDRTFPSAGNRRTWSFSVWFKRGNTGGTNNTANKDVFLGGINNNNMIRIADDQLQWYVYDGSADYGWISTAFVRDVSAWYHVLFVFDTTSGTATHRQRIYLNGVELTDKATDYGNPPQNYDGLINTAGLHTIGKGIAGEHFDGHLAEVNFIDGLAKAPADFGETGDYGEWKPIEYEGSYGTNGFYLPFKQDYTVEGFSTVTYKGFGLGQYIGGVGFTPDFVWTKCRSTSGKQHILVDAIRGGNKNLMSDSSEAENSASNRRLTLGAADGYVINSNSGHLNEADKTYVSWNWDMGGSNATNTTGSIQSTVRVNASYGQSIVSWTGNATGGASVGTGLSSAAELIILKNRETAGWWRVHDNISGKTNGRLGLQATDAQSTDYAITFQSGKFTFDNDSGAHEDWNGNNDGIIAYCFHSVTAYSKIGTYDGSGSSGKAVTTGFKPAFLIIKSTNTAQDWLIFDNARNPTAPQTLQLKANASTADGNPFDHLNFTDTGFTLLSGNDNVNASSSNYIYMAFADKREYAYWLDQSGNNNDWTSNNLTESDVMVDSPTNNFPTWNSLSSSALPTLSEGNLKNNGENNKTLNGTFGVSTGKWYWEVAVIDRSSIAPYIGVTKFSMENDPDASPTLAATSGRSVYRFRSTPLYKNFTATAYANDSAHGLSDNGILGLALDLDNGTLKYYVNNTLYHTDSTIPSDGTTLYPLVTQTNSGGSNWNKTVANFGQDSSFSGLHVQKGNQDGNSIGDFYYAPPSGFLALCTSNLPDVAVVPSEHFNTVLYTGNATNRNITNVGFAPDFTWLKARSIAYGHRLIDTVRGAPNVLASQSTSAENTSETTGLTAFRTDGFTLGTSDGLNKNGDTFVAWNWKANGSGSSNSSGDITSTVSANADAGFSIVKYTATGTTGHTVGHGLGAIPDAMFWKSLTTQSWNCFFPNTSMGATKGLQLDNSGAQGTVANMNNTMPTSSVFSLGANGAAHNAFADGVGQAYIVYCFKSIEGYSKCSSFVGNGSADGVFVYTGFRPMLVLTKQSSTTGSWTIHDAKRDIDNPLFNELIANGSDADHTSDADMDFTSNGFKIRRASGQFNTNGATVIYLAFAETPFKYSNAR